MNQMNTPDRPPATTQTDALSQEGSSGAFIGHRQNQHFARLNRGMTKLDYVRAAITTLFEVASIIALAWLISFIVT
jgi:hypothetical protein